MRDSIQNRLFPADVILVGDDMKAKLYEVYGKTEEQCDNHWKNTWDDGVGKMFDGIKKRKEIDNKEWSDWATLDKGPNKDQYIESQMSSGLSNRGIFAAIENLQARKKAFEKAIEDKPYFYEIHQDIQAGLFVINNPGEFNIRIPDQLLVTEVHDDHIRVDFLESTLEQTWYKSPEGRALRKYLQSLKLDPNFGKYYQLGHCF